AQVADHAGALGSRNKEGAGVRVKTSRVLMAYRIVAREIARGHGGDVSVASAGKGKGSTFTLRLPVNRG
ncbi:MAG: hypothetical protein HZA25_00870, partial [Candidatus Niyogibacteria bacterium]|nr:hypothetical protein [Candidatus Niyogibacteria bacterium]